MIHTIRRMVLALALLTLAASAAAGAVTIDGSSFPDAAFRACVEALDADGDGALSDEEIAAVASLDVSKRGIASLKGVELFTALTELACYDNALTSLDLSGNPGLLRLECDNNRLSRLDLSGVPNVKWLECELNGLAELDLEGNTKLAYVKCYGQTIEGLEIEGVAESEGGGYRASLGAYVSELTRVVSADVRAYDGKGGEIERVSYDEAAGAAVFASRPATVVYAYRTGHGEGDGETLMEVTLVASDAPGDVMYGRRGRGCDVGLGFGALMLLGTALAVRKK